MNLEYLLYIIPPFIVVLVGERYKDMSTAKYAVFIFSVLMLTTLAIIISDGETFLTVKFTLTLILSVTALATFMFHMHKRERRIKNAKAALKINQ